MATSPAAEALLPDEDLVPEWDLADRMTKSLRVRGISVGAMAEAFGLSRETIGRWLSGRAVPDKGRLHFWSVLTGVSLEWLETGKAPVAEATEAVKRARRDSNPKPSDSESRHLRSLPSVSLTLTPNPRAEDRPCLRLVEGL